MFCPKCGADNPDGARFCGKCGAVQPPPPPPSATPPPPPPTGVSNTQKTWVSVASLFVPLVGLILGIQYMNKPEPETKKVGRLYLIMAVVGIVLYTMCGILGSLGNS